MARWRESFLQSATLADGGRDRGAAPRHRGPGVPDRRQRHHPCPRPPPGRLYRSTSDSEFAARRFVEPQSDDNLREDWAPKITRDQEALVESYPRSLERATEGQQQPLEWQTARCHSRSNRKEYVMKLQLRRVVTGDMTTAAPRRDRRACQEHIGSRPGVSSCVVWSTKGFRSTMTTTTIRPRLVRHHRRGRHGVSRRALRAGRGPAQPPYDSIDYAIVVSGEIDMELDDKVVVSSRLATRWCSAAPSKLGQPWHRGLRHRVRVDQRRTRRPPPANRSMQFASLVSSVLEDYYAAAFIRR